MLTRYPAIPLLVDRFTDNTLVILDDTIRYEEKKTTLLWESEFPGLCDRQNIGKAMTWSYNADAPRKGGTHP